MSSSRDDIAALIFTYAERIDAGDLDGVAALFRDATYRSRQGGSYEGSAAVRAVLAQKVILYADGTPRTKHVTSNLIVEVDASVACRTVKYERAVALAPDALPLQAIVAGRYHDRFVRDGDAWRFVERLIFVDLVGNLSQHLRG